MGLSFHDEGTTVESSSTGTGLRFSPGDDEVSTLEIMGRIVNSGPEGGCDAVDFREGNYNKEPER